MQISGVLQTGKSNALIESVREALPAVLPDEEVLSFVIGDDQIEVEVTLTKRLFSEAYRYGPNGVGLVVRQGDLKLTIADQEQLLAAVEQLHGRR